jgi:hypothetical protein
MANPDSMLQSAPLPLHGAAARSTNHAHQGSHIVDTCLTECTTCGMDNRIFAVTDHGVMTRCFRCGDQWEQTRIPWWCDHALKPTLEEPPPAPPVRFHERPLPPLPLTVKPTSLQDTTVNNQPR